MAESNNSTLIKIEDVSAVFQGITAVDNVRFTLEKGKIYGLIGTNGAGKSTLLNMISGNIHPTSGRILYKGKEINRSSSHTLAEKGIARTFQNLRLFGKETVIENVKVAGHGKFRYSVLQMLFNTKTYRNAEKKLNRKSFEILRNLDIEKYAERRADSLPYGIQRKTEIARCLALNPNLLLLDEPAAGMNPKESAQLVKDIREVHKKNPEMTILIIEHDMKVVMSLCDYIYTMASGKIIDEGTPEEIQNSEKVIELYLGHGKYAESKRA